MGKELKAVTPVNDYISVHPALDFWDSTAILSVGCKWQETWQITDRRGNQKEDEVIFTANPYCIMSTGDKFRFTKKEMAARSLFYSGRIELPEKSRWDYDDIQRFGEDEYSPSFAELFQTIRKEFEYYVDYIDPRYYDLMACFVIYTYFYPMFFNAPVLQFWGEMRTGKTKSLTLLECMVFNPVNSANITGASVFRLIETRRATILFDESEDLMTSERAREIRNMLLAGTGKSGETYRQEKQNDDSFATRSFKVFSPKVIANIAGIDMPALLSRTIRISTVATKDQTKDNRCVELEDEKWQEIRNQLYRVCLGRFTEVENVKSTISGIGITGRTLYIWQGILTIARLTDNIEMFNNLVELAKENKDEMEAEIELFNEEPEEMLEKLIDIAKDGKEYYSPTELLLATSSFGITSKRDLAFKLGKLGLKARGITINGKYGRYYWLTPKKLQERLKR